MTPLALIFGLFTFGVIGVGLLIFGASVYGLIRTSKQPGEDKSIYVGPLVGGLTICLFGAVGMNMVASQSTFDYLFHPVQAQIMGLHKDLSNAEYYAEGQEYNGAKVGKRPFHFAGQPGNEEYTIDVLDKNGDFNLEVRYKGSSGSILYSYDIGAQEREGSYSKIASPNTGKDYEYSNWAAWSGYPYGEDDY